jgi:hypothetical protein
MTKSSPLVANSDLRGPITFRVSRLKRDYIPASQMLSDDDLSLWVQNYVKHAVKFLSEHGYYPVTILYVNGYDDELIGKFSWQSNSQEALRSAIMASYLRPPEQTVQKSLTYLAGDNHGKA